jgi:hypothetical protein
LQTHPRQYLANATRGVNAECPRPLHGTAQNVLDYLLANNNVKEIMKFNAAADVRSLAGYTAQSLFGLQWHAAYQAFFGFRKRLEGCLISGE